MHHVGRKLKEWVRCVDSEVHRYVSWLGIRQSVTTSE